MSIRLCCNINPTKKCKNCKDMFCDDHVFTPPKLYPGDKEIYPSQCFTCLETDRGEVLNKTKGNMTARELFVEVRKLAPKGYISISFQVQEGRPDYGFNTEWRIYHETLKDVKGTTPEAVLACFKSKVEGSSDPQLTDLDKVF